MANLRFENDVSSMCRMDAPLTNGPQMRWQRKQCDLSSLHRSDVGCSFNTSSNRSLASVSSKTPRKNKSLCTTAKTPRKTPGKTPGKNAATPGRGVKTPGKSKTPGKTKTPTADRYIPNRSACRFDLGHFLINKDKSDDDNVMQSPSKRDFRNTMQEHLGGDIANQKILSWRTKAPAADNHVNPNKILYSTSKTPGIKSYRQIPQAPERILDAPELRDDFYLNLLDWSVDNLLAVSLDNQVYLWNAGTGDIQQLLSLEAPEEYVCSVSWIADGHCLAVGTSDATVQLWDVHQKKRVRLMRSQAARVGSLAWNSYILSSGSRSGCIHHHDVRVEDHHVGTLEAHSQEICGLKWSPDGKHLASGGNDNVVQVWSAHDQAPVTHTEPTVTFTQHQGAVKALAWCPWQPSLIASGGGTSDRHIRIWNANTGHCCENVDTKSQVCSLLWSNEHRELISSHGFAQNQLCIWKYPSMKQVAELTGHTARVLHMALSPDGTTVVSAAADETLRIWKCFDKDPQREKKGATKKAVATSTMFRHNIR